MKRLLKNKKGAEMTIGTIVVIILALVVLVVLIVGFTGGWSNMWNWLTNLVGGGGSTLDAVKNGCVTACSTNAKSSYCDEARNVKFGDQDTATIDGKYNCVAMAKIGKIEECSQFSECGEKRDCKAWGGHWVDGACPQGENTIDQATFIMLDTKTGQNCCKPA